MHSCYHNGRKRVKVQDNTFLSEESGSDAESIVARLASNRIVMLLTVL